MRALVPSETALVLGGGGAKGAYEVGAIAALDELGIKAGSVFGTSVGALHAAMYAQGSMDAAAALWDNIRLSDVVSEESLAIADDAENIFDHPEKLLEFITRYAQKKGVDVSPLMDILHKLIDEDKIRRSGVHLGIVTTRFPSLAMVEKRLEEMETGSLIDWLMASASCFPIFPMKQVGGDRYIDGGFCDNTPVEMAVRSGARDIVAIDIGKHRSHTQYDRRPNITYIRTSQPLGGLLTLDSALSARNRILGYNDVMRAFGRMRGVSYSFDAVDAQALYARAQDYVIHLTQLETSMCHSNALTRTREIGAPFFSLLEEDLPEKADCIDYLLRGCELCAQIAEVNPAQVLTFAALRDELHARLPLEKAESMLGSLLGGRVGVLFSKPQIDRKLVISCLYHLLMREGSFSPLALRTLSAFPREMLCALTLKEIL
ncbi:MAG: patatin-like phospholipase family protein [Christensenellales bacterium]|nr:patatin-like phospholipase family protein [Christensenellales bacterium]